MSAPLCVNASVPRDSDSAGLPLVTGRRLRPVIARASGFTLVELMITVAIVAILATIAYPSYTDYITRGKLANVTNMLAGIRAQMEQYYQDNRTYAAVGTFTPPCQAISSVAEFSLACNITNNGNSYQMTATGSGTTAGFTYTVNEANVQATTAAPRGWNTSTTCWVTKRGQSC
ncbi:prepilin-type N-terminal cleavage/methylation domain-containing protein [Ralstonia sp. TCR112]|uniref:type IV pilin protein n=1 Tax=Ralstonia sp. TCR112 TaxID=2601730 RepID=UPI0011BF62C3|nr:type IV pilin protein [Ralstonia sp. TCR112]TXD56982.1 prepilin-type N-terminal cleavage/methylation domain-containing protein [Ralstonia sp. TCR112]